MNPLLGLIRFTLTMLLILGTMIPLTLIGLLPFRARRAKWSSWFVTGLARIFMRINGIRWRCTDSRLLGTHHGLVFTNHSSYLDPVVLMAVRPMRFLAAAEVSRRPFINWIANAADTVYVDRSDRQSRRAARRSISAALHKDPFPPVVIFPEGKLGPGDYLYPMRHGAFETAIQSNVPFLPCAVYYNRPDVSTWYGGLRNESLIHAVWRMMCYRGRLEIELIPLLPVATRPDDSPALLAEATQRQIEHVLGFPPSPTVLNPLPDKTPSP